MSKTLMIVGHPQWPVSFANKNIVEEFSKENPSAVVSNLFVEYPDGKIDVEAEQKKLLDADTIVLQFPIEWYGAPSIMHKWVHVGLPRLSKVQPLPMPQYFRPAPLYKW